VMQVWYRDAPMLGGGGFCNFFEGRGPLLI